MEAESNKEEVVEETKTTEEKINEAYEAATKFEIEPKEVNFKIESKTYQQAAQPVFLLKKIK